MPPSSAGSKPMPNSKPSENHSLDAPPAGTAAGLIIAPPFCMNNLPE